MLGPLLLIFDIPRKLLNKSVLFNIKSYLLDSSFRKSFIRSNGDYTSVFCKIAVFLLIFNNPISYV